MAINRHITITIAQGSPLSEGFQLDTGNLVGILMPDAFTGNSLAFEILRPTDGAFLPHFDSMGQEVNIAAAPSRSIALDDEIQGLPTRGFVRVRANQIQNQAAQLICVITEF
ncbi:MAG: hypothetical protein NTW74_25875 [Acidobacteria bacterium]|nr:hypothetical protein [Acidobacteriota bacterium]